jgi:hypothetical protein
MQDGLLAPSSSGNLKFSTAVATMAHIVNHSHLQPNSDAALLRTGQLVNIPDHIVPARRG